MHGIVAKLKWRETRQVLVGERRAAFLLHGAVMELSMHAISRLLKFKR